MLRAKEGEENPMILSSQNQVWTQQGCEMVSYQFSHGFGRVVLQRVWTWVTIGEPIIANMPGVNFICASVLRTGAYQVSQFENLTKCRRHRFPCRLVKNDKVHFSRHYEVQQKSQSHSKFLKKKTTMSTIYQDRWMWSKLHPETRPYLFFGVHLTRNSTGMRTLVMDNISLSHCDYKKIRTKVSENWRYNRVRVNGSTLVGGRHR